MILVFGTICIDRVRRIPCLPPPGGYVEMSDDMAMLGGEAANTANALVEWGVKVRLAGNHLGIGPEGELLERMLHDKHLPLEDLCRGDVDSPVCDIYITPDGDRTMFGKGFSRMKDTIDPSLVPYQKGHWFTAEPNMGEVALEVVRLAYAAGMKIYLMDFFREDDPIYPGSYWQTSTDWVGSRGAVEENVAWLQALVDRRGCYGILTDGPRGFAAGGLGLPVRWYPALSVDGVVDTTGAGDVFRAGMLYGLLAEWPAEHCLSFASSAAGLSCRSLGATGLLPTVAEVEGFTRACHTEDAG